jgi:beta-phosphoglucomutase-like phosphatase (HAD superfamily)
MNVIVFESEAYEKLWNELMEKFEARLANQTKISSEIQNDWLNLEEAKKLLGIKSKSKMQQLRDEGLIRFSQHGRIIRYSKESIIEFLEKNTK